MAGPRRTVLTRAGIDPIRAETRIVNPDGTPTDIFLRNWLGQRRGNTGTATDLASAIALVNALSAQTIVPDVGELTGGGALGQPTPILLGLANSGVTPGAYTSANITVDAFGRVTVAANGSGGGGSPDTVTALIGQGSQVGTSQAFAFVGNAYTPNRDITAYRVQCFLTATVNNAVYTARIVSVNGSHVIQAIVGTTASFVNSGTASKTITFDLITPAALVNGTRYLILVGRTDATTTTATSFSAGNAADNYYTAPGITDAAFYGLAQTVPAVGQTATQTVSAFRYTHTLHYGLGPIVTLPMTVFGATGDCTGISTTAVATKGIGITPLQDITISAIYGRIDAAAAQNHNAVIAQINNLTSGTIVGAPLGVSATVATTTTDGRDYEFIFTPPITLTAGNSYLLAVTNQSGVGTTVCRIGDVAYASTFWQLNFRCTMGSVLDYNTLTLTNGQTPTGTAANFGHAIYARGSI